MTLARRLLMVVGSLGGDAPVVLTPETFTLSSAPEGGWTMIPDPKTLYHNGKTYFTWVNGSSGAIKIAAYDHTTQTTGAAFSVDDLGSPDTHDSPSLMVRDSDKRIIVAYSRHDGAAMYIRVSTNPEDVTAFDARVDLDASVGGNDYTYPSIIQLAGVANDPIYIFYRDITSGQDGRLAYTKSTDGGATWSARTILYNGITNRVEYWRLGTDFERYVHIFTTDREWYDQGDPAKVGHFYLDGSDDKIYTSADVEITAAKPIAFTDITQVHGSGDGTTWCTGVAVHPDTPTRAAALLMVAIGSTDQSMRTARYRSGAWQINEVGTHGGVFAPNRFSGSGAIHHEDENVVYFAKLVSGKWELYRHVSTNDGVTWTATALTSGSASDNLWVEVPHNADVGLGALWQFGTYTGDTNNSLGVKAWGLR